MTNEKAQRLYFINIASSMTVFLLLSAFIALAAKPLGLPDWVTIGLAVTAGLLLVNAVWAQWRYINRIDEFLRSIQIKATLAGIGTVLCVASIWGYLELYLDAARLPVLYLNPLFWVAYALAAAFFSRQANGEK